MVTDEAEKRRLIDEIISYAENKPLSVSYIGTLKAMISMLPFSEEKASLLRAVNAKKPVKDVIVERAKKLRE